MLSVFGNSIKTGENWSKEKVDKQVYFCLFDFMPELHQEIDEESKWKIVREISEKVIAILKKCNNFTMTCEEMTELINVILFDNFYNFLKENPSIGKDILPDLPDDFWQEKLKKTKGTVIRRTDSQKKIILTICSLIIEFSMEKKDDGSLVYYHQIIPMFPADAEIIDDVEIPESIMHRIRLAIRFGMFLKTIKKNFLKLMATMNAGVLIFPLILNPD